MALKGTCEDRTLFIVSQLGCGVKVCVCKAAESLPPFIFSFCFFFHLLAEMYGALTLSPGRGGTLSSLCLPQPSSLFLGREEHMGINYWRGLIWFRLRNLPKIHFQLILGWSQSFQWKLLLVPKHCLPLNLSVFVLHLRSKLVKIILHIHVHCEMMPQS